MTDFQDEEISMAEASLQEQQRQAKSERLNGLWDQLDEGGDGLGLEGWIFE